MKLLIDENLSPRLVQLLAAKGVPATHVAHLGMAGAADPDVWEHAFENDQIVVTVNASDFLLLAGGVELHCGLIVFRTSRGLSREEQWTWLRPVVEWLAASAEPLINRAVIVAGEDDFTVVDLPLR